ncbi:phosphate ABC transporter membrane protein [Salinisphaera sp. PC39]|uniref:phosphate ABC transporter permease subunit PstC n=1 Tax=Salinisphaera sp. PC39 TaxID=1304156 RepID=UPI003341E4BA
MRRSDLVLEWSLRACAALAALIVAFIFYFLLCESGDAALGIGLARFVDDPSWHPAAEAETGTFNLLPMVAGTLLAAGGAVLLATPLGLLSALFCRYFAPPTLAGPYRRLIELLAGIPSVVYGLWGLVVLVPLIGAWQPPGASLLAAMLILTLMILPTVTLFADAALVAVPRANLHAGAALGLSRFGLITGVLLPAARGGIATGVLLAMGRAMGETMAVLMVAGNVVQVPASIFEPVRTLTANIALEMAYALGDHRAALFFTGLVLLLLVTALVTLAARIERTHG